MKFKTLPLHGVEKGLGVRYEFELISKKSTE
jgi:hypothetical protein